MKVFALAARSFGIWFVFPCLSALAAQSQRRPIDPPQTDTLPQAWLSRASEAIRQSEYHFSEIQDEVWSAPNQSQELRSLISRNGIEVVPRGTGPRFKLSLRTASFGRGLELQELSCQALSARENRVELDHGLLTEWFVNDERGIEQGWTIERRPGGDPKEPLWIALKVAGDLAPIVDDDRRSARWVNASGVSRLHYRGLTVRDGSGRELDAALASHPHGLGIQVDDGGALYPLRVDPILAGPWTAESNQEDAYFGYSVATAGDVNGDGYSDVIVGAPLFDNGQAGEGRAFVYLGSALGLAANAAWTRESNQADAGFGTSVATAGDVNRDGYADVIVGAVGFDNGQAGEGRAYVYLGSSTGLATSAVWIAEGNSANAGFGHEVATAGDVNGDGRSDVIVGAPSYGFFQGDPFYFGRASVYLGSGVGLAASAAWTAEGSQYQDYFGESVGTAGDVNGDGYSDVIVGSCAGPGGTAYVYLGSAVGLSTTAVWNVPGSLGHASVGTAGDVNGDGYSDVIVADTEGIAVSQGIARAYLGSALGLATSAAWTAEGATTFGGFGQSLGTAGDVNGDGRSDVIVGEPGAPPAGASYVYVGSATGLSASPAWMWSPGQGPVGFGYSVGTAGDVNGDGYSDVIVGDPYFENGEIGEGRAFVFYGLDHPLAPVAPGSFQSGGTVQVP